MWRFIKNCCVIGLLLFILRINCKVEQLSQKLIDENNELESSRSESTLLSKKMMVEENDIQFGCTQNNGCLAYDVASSSTFFPIKNNTQSTTKTSEVHDSQHCIWSYGIGPNSTTKLRFERSVGENEFVSVIVEYHNGTSIALKYTDISYINPEIEMEFKDADRVEISANLISPNCLLSIDITNENQTKIFEIKLGALKMIIAIICVYIIIYLVGMSLFCALKLASKLRQRSNLSMKTKLISKVMNSMKTGKWENLKQILPYKQTECVICLENFNANDEVQLTDQCGHIFHKKCLYGWLGVCIDTKNQPARKDSYSFRCPLCNSVKIEQT